MSLDRTCPGEIYLGLFLKEPGDEFPKARYRRCGSLLGKDRMYCDECQADMDMRRARNFAEDYPSTLREPS